jgi:PPOX class probable FMN-dependent enzyme
MDLDPSFVLADPAELRELYGPAAERSLRKQINRLDDHCRAFIAASPLLFIGTQGAGSALAECSPRGDQPGFVKVADDHTLLIPDRRGNNRLDTLQNILANPRVGLLFVVPGLTETFRVNGEAVISRDPALTSQFIVQEKAPRTVIVLAVKEAYLQCSRALVRADAWNPEKFLAKGTLPSFGTMLEAHTGGFVNGRALDAENQSRISSTLY